MDCNEIKSIAESIREKISENNKDKKNAWELKNSGVSKKKKAEAQAEIKQHADKAKEEQKIADDYDNIATHAGCNHDKFNYYNNKYEDHALKAQSHNIDKQKIAGEIRKKLGREEASEGIVGDIVDNCKNKVKKTLDDLNPFSQNNNETIEEAVPALATAIARGVTAIAKNPHVQKGLAAFGDAYASKAGEGVGNHLADKTIEVVKKKLPVA